ncbi:MAG TPA: acireductone synthase, partial [Pseudoxanthomonas sp.]|nr:acireductone synthase [Pseudoxanthomonas sp.]
MITPVPRAILTDIEGTTSSISFVKDVLFPYARRALPGFVREHGQQPEVRRWLDAVAI